MEYHAKVGKVNGSVGGYAVFYKCDVNSPVLAAGGKFFGAIEGVDNPYAVFAEAFWVIGCFFGEEAVVGAVLLEYAGDPVLCEVVAGFAEFASAEKTHVAHSFEDLACAFG